MKREINNISILVWVSVNIISLVLSEDICRKADEPVLIFYTTSPSVDSVQWKLNGAFFHISTLETDGLTCIAPPPPVPADYEVLCSYVNVSGLNYFGLNILKPKDGDNYYTTNATDNRKLIVPEPPNLTVDSTSNIQEDTVLPSTDTISMECQSSSCTKKQPNIKWKYTTGGGAINTTISNTYIQSRLDATGCTGTLTKINSKVDISIDSVPLKDVPFRVVCVLSYDVCTDIEYENITDHTITIKGTTEPEGVAVWIIVIIVIIVIIIVIVIVIIIVIVMKKRKKAKPDPPSELTISTNETGNICVKWTPGFDGGAKQHFIVQHSDGKSWTDSTAIYVTEHFIETVFRTIRVIARNEHGDSTPIYLSDTDSAATEKDNGTAMTLRA